MDREPQDFGFEIEDVIEEVPAQEDTRAGIIFELINTFLEKFKANPNANTIKWPNRVIEIETFQEKLKNIMEGN